MADGSYIVEICDMDGAALKPRVTAAHPGRLRGALAMLDAAEAEGASIQQIKGFTMQVIADRFAPYETGELRWFLIQQQVAIVMRQATDRKEGS